MTAFAEVAKSQKENAEDIEKLPGTLVFIGTVDEEARYERVRSSSATRMDSEGRLGS